jgi:hypothetical protein
MSWLLRICLALTAIAACGSAYADKAEIKAPVGVVSMLGGDATLVTIGMTIFGNALTHKPAPALDMDAYLQDAVVAALAKDGGAEPQRLTDTAGIGGKILVRPRFFSGKPTQEVTDKVLGSVAAESGTVVAVLPFPSPVLQTPQEKHGYGLVYFPSQAAIQTFVSADIVAIDVASRSVVGMGHPIGDRHLDLEYVPTEEERAQEEAELHAAIEEAETFGSDADPLETADLKFKLHHTPETFASISAKDRDYIFNRIREQAAAGIAGALKAAKLLD